MPFGIENVQVLRQAFSKPVPFPDFLIFFATSIKREIHDNILRMILHFK